jgi:hypothetical protein
MEHVSTHAAKRVRYPALDVLLLGAFGYARYALVFADSSVRLVPELLSGLSGPAAQASARSAGDIAAPVATPPIEGLVRDITCPIQNRESTETKFNLKWTRECAGLGSPLIVLTNDGVLRMPISASMPDKREDVDSSHARDSGDVVT